MNSTVGASTATITGGTLTSANIAALATGNAATNANGVADLIVINNNSTAGSSVVVNSVIADNGAYPVGLTAGSTLGTAPSGPIQLGGANTFTGPTYITKGTLQLINSLALQNSTLNYSLPGTLSFGTLTAATLGGLSGANGLVLTNSSGAAVALSVGNNNSTLPRRDERIRQSDQSWQRNADSNKHKYLHRHHHCQRRHLGRQRLDCRHCHESVWRQHRPRSGRQCAGNGVHLNSNLTLSAGSALIFNVSTNLGSNDMIVANGTMTLNAAVFHIKAPSTTANLALATMC